MSRSFIRLLFALISIVLATAGATSYPPALQQLVDQGARVHAHFDTPAGLDGYAISISGHAMIVYTTADGQYLLSGPLLDAKGNDLTTRYAQEHLPVPDHSADWKKLEAAAWVAQGAKHPTRIIYNFTDMNCPYCHRFWQLAQRYADKGVQVRHIIVGVLTSTSRGKAAAVLQAADPAAAFAAAENRFAQGGVPPLARIQPQVLARIKANEKLMYSLGIRGTPAVFYRTAGGKVHLIAGVPRADQLDAVFGAGPDKAH